MPRDIRESHEFRQQCAHLGLHDRRIDDIQDGVRQLLHHDAESFEQVPGTTWYFVPLGGNYVQAFSLYFEIINDDLIELMWIDTAANGDDPDDPVD